MLEDKKKLEEDIKALILQYEEKYPELHITDIYYKERFLGRMAGENVISHSVEVVVEVQ